jgi:hypothetical protein
MKKYLESIRQLIKLKYHAFKKEKVKHSIEELERQDEKLRAI